MATETQSDAPPLEGGEVVDSDKTIENTRQKRYLVMLETDSIGLEIIKAIRPMAFCKAVEYETCSGVNDYGEFE